jgi:P27 family predicted phage terminase small subunit
MIGRRPVPSALKILRGNPGRRPLNSREPDAPLVTVLPKPPRYLGRIAAAMFRKKGAQLIAVGMLTVLDLEALASYAKWHEIKLKASTRLRLDEIGTQANINVLNAFSMASKAIRLIDQEFGLSPASRSRIKVANPKQTTLFDEFLSEAPEPDDQARRELQ